MIFYDYHNIPITGHSSIHKIYMAMKKKYFWLSMKKDVWKYVEKCFPCQISKAKQVKTLGSLQPLGVFNTKFGNP
jgi:hypothetical protein